MQRARLKLVVPVTLAIILLLLYLSFGRIGEALLIMGTLPFALVVGFVALAGVAAEMGVVMLVYLDQALVKRQRTAEGEGRTVTLSELREAMVEGALLRVRPKIITVSAIIAGLLPIMFGSGTGSEVMRRIATPMVGGMVSATVLTLVVIPAAFLLWKQYGLRGAQEMAPGVVLQPSE